ncbi:hypothetical protein C8R45DRAFT_1178834 [Mycena sanguinolenta]|nr:hypothetical protein C8R45DRAFT_1178834 [Mycena sanguinolenta]
MGGLRESLLLNSFYRPVIHIVVSPLLSPPQAYDGAIMRPLNGSTANYAVSLHGGTGGSGGRGTSNGVGGKGGVGEGPSLFRHANNVTIITDPTLLQSHISLLPGWRLVAPNRNDVSDLPGLEIAFSDHEVPKDIKPKNVSKGVIHATQFRS